MVIMAEEDPAVSAFRPPASLTIRGYRHDGPAGSEEKAQGIKNFEWLLDGMRIAAQCVFRKNGGNARET